MADFAKKMAIKELRNIFVIKQSAEISSKAVAFFLIISQIVCKKMESRYVSIIPWKSGIVCILFSRKAHAKGDDSGF